MKNRICQLLLLWMIPLLLSAQESVPEPDPLPGPEALYRYLEMAAENNPGLQVKFNEYMAALEAVPQVTSLPDPQLAFAYFIRPVETRVGPQRFRVSASQFFPWFGTLDAKGNMALQNAKAKYELFEQTRSKLYSDIKSVYFNLYVNAASIQIIAENLELLDAIRNLATVKVEAGLASMLDEYRVGMEINDMENQLALLRDKQWVLEGEFRNLLHAEESLDIFVPGQMWRSDFPLTREAARDSILQGNHQLLQLEFRRNALAYRKEVAEKHGRPDIMVGLDYTFVGQGENNLAGRDAIVFPKIGIRIPLYRNKYRAMVKEVAYLEAANEQASVDRSNSLETLFNRAWKDYLDAGRRIGLNEEQMRIAKKALKLLESEYATAGRNLEEILRMERRLLRYNLEFEKALADKQAAIAFINYLMGK